ncbi:MAG TPA: aromatic ring-hydroxylating dioxygenase subunit alpha [Phenylobacterium sp.]|uniref:aromatic ring-hydroxylating dioxygenase subunit alpha n=1 Tax=Phenylobacterium sp. TaxID=1871053 RepID=UPI002B45BF5A|nr:aromatic ring-hydroxylating dioxygenase subunit alpha [Phenylobacterium sp.]HKR88560.1 aromatic ring-hydroxylating dioxygenase subunit alpha [Phenylobacterium sp.]
MFLRNAWYAGAWGHEVEGDKLLPRKLLGDAVVFYRKSDGSAAVLRDRCSHRFAPLSIGRKEGDCVRCMYHGLVFDADGVCVEEPGKSRPSPNLDIRAYPVVERWKLIWVWMGDPALADPDLVPDCHFQDDPAWASIPAYIHYDADYRLILDNLMDFSHLTFVHENTLGGSATIAATRPKIEQTDGGVRITRWYPGEPEIAPYLRGVETFQGPIDRWNIYELQIAGNVFLMDSGSAPAGTGAPEGVRVPQAMQFRATQIVTPEDEHHSHFFWTYAHNFDISNADLTRKLAARLTTGFQEDKDMIEAQQKVIDEYGEDGMGYIFADNGLALFRRLLRARIDAEQGQAPKLAAAG